LRLVIFVERYLCTPGVLSEQREWAAEKFARGHLTYFGPSAEVEKAIKLANNKNRVQHSELRVTSSCYE